MKMQNRTRRCLAIALALLCTISLLSANATMAAGVTQADIDELKDDASSLSQQQKELEAQLEDLKDDKSRALEHKSVLDQQIANTSARISNVEAQIANYDALITQTEQELAQAEEQEAEQYELFCSRVRRMEKQGEVSYWSVLFNATSFTDLLSRLDIINEIMDADQRVIDDLQALQEEIRDKKASLEDSRAASEEARSQLVSQKEELNTQRAAADALVKEIQANESEYQSTLDALAAEEEAVQEEIVRLSRELAAQQAAQGLPSGSAAGGYIWPVSSRRITSRFGNRNTGIAGASTNHTGVDIGGVGYTTPVQAAKAGTVIVSQQSSGYGNYVVVSHGSGNTTLYAHMSSRSVSGGDYVNQGDVLGITGSTGISSGPHLHFEITENGQRIDPLTYLTGYIQAW